MSCIRSMCKLQLGCLLAFGSVMFRSRANAPGGSSRAAASELVRTTCRFPGLSSLRPARTISVRLDCCETDNSVNFQRSNLVHVVRCQECFRSHGLPCSLDTGQPCSERHVIRGHCHGVNQTVEAARNPSPELATCAATLSSAAGISETAVSRITAPKHSWLASVPCAVISLSAQLMHHSKIEPGIQRIWSMSRGKNLRVSCHVSTSHGAAVMGALYPDPNL